MSPLGLALLAAGLTGLVAGLLGVPLVLRDLSMFGFGLAHAAFSGVALGLAVSSLPMVWGVAAALAGAWTLTWLERHGGIREETALATVTLAGLSLGLVVAAASGLSRGDVATTLFGSPLAVQSGDALRLGAVALVGVVAFAVLEKEIVYATFDREAAALAGVPVRGLDAGLMALTSVAVVVAAEVAGLLLVGALLVLPAAAGLKVARTFRGALAWAALAGVLAGAGGVALGWAAGVDNGAPVVLAGVVALGAGAALGRLRGARAGG